ncbi:MAG TPA: FHA domain-containing protein [Acidobacteriota bacterium]|nr:FHA domain-containing protein [Acidobacteriota bacterium]
MFHHSTGLGDKSRANPDGRSQAQFELENGTTFQIQDVATVGRAPDSNIILDSRSISRHHARIFYEGGHYWLKDLDSANGTTLNGKKIKLQMLSDKDKIIFGDVKGVFHFVGQIGPAAIASDPLEGSDPAFDDGTPTGGLPGRTTSADRSRLGQAGKGIEEARVRSAAAEKEVRVLREKVTALQRENDRLTASLKQALGTSADTSMASQSVGSAGGLEQQNEQLKKLVKQLERALADSNLRIRNLQERLDRNSD